MRFPERDRDSEREGERQSVTVEESWKAYFSEDPVTVFQT
jgi:hypothetical protein